MSGEQQDDFGDNDVENEYRKELQGGSGGDYERLTASSFPNSPHPASKTLDEINFEDLPDGFFVVVYGARRTGKTHSSSCLLESIKDRFDFAYLFSETANLHEGQKGEEAFEMIRPEAKFKGFDDEILTRIIERQAAVLEHNNKCKYKRDHKPNRTLIIFDDFVHDKRIRYSELFTKLPVLGRHYGISVICLSQGYSAVGSSGLNTATRDNCDYVMTFLPRNINNIEKMAMWYLTKGKPESMWFIKSVCETEFQCLGIDLQHPNLTEFEDYCSSYLAPKEIPHFELGKEQWRLFRDERKRSKKAAMARRVENDRTFFLGRDEIEKRLKIGEATGLPAGGPKHSLFDLCAMNG